MYIINAITPLMKTLMGFDQCLSMSDILHPSLTSPDINLLSMSIGSTPKADCNVFLLEF